MFIEFIQEDVPTWNSISRATIGQKEVNAMATLNG
jgi:hypothetical protein